MKHVSLLIKPASSQCNMRCRYCFYDDVSENRSAKSMGLMSRKTLHQLVQAAFAASEYGGTVSFAFQGGEPTLAGLDFFRDFMAMETRYAPAGVERNYAIQTNGITLDEAWAEFFHDNHFLVGISIDGTSALNDLYRLDGKQRGTWTRVTHSLNLLQKKQVDVNLLCVVTGQSARSPQKVYSALKKLGGRYIQFIPCLDPIEKERGTAPYSLSPKAYGKFLCGLFDAWYLDWKGGHYISVRLFDDFIHLMLGIPSGSCATSGSCGDYFVVEGDGSLYPCDFYVLDQWRLGSVEGDCLAAVGKSDLAKQFLAEGEQKPVTCSTCPWRTICCGGCKRDWQWIDGKLENYYCPAFQQFFTYAMPRLSEIAEAEFRVLTGQA